VVAIVGAFERPPQFFARVGLRAMEGLFEPLVIDAVAEPEGHPDYAGEGAWTAPQVKCVKWLVSNPAFAPLSKLGPG
jgi:hypothetical protein